MTPALSPTTLQPKADGWLRLEGDETHGPYAEAEMAALARDGVISPDSYVWRPGLAEWMVASHFFLFHGEPTPEPPPVDEVEVLPPRPARPLESQDDRSTLCGVLSVVFALVALFVWPPVFGLAGFELAVVGLTLRGNKLFPVAGAVLSVVLGTIGVALRHAVTP